MLWPDGPLSSHTQTLLYPTCQSRNGITKMFVCLVMKNKFNLPVMLKNIHNENQPKIALILLVLTLLKRNHN